MRLLSLVALVAIADCGSETPPASAPDFASLQQSTTGGAGIKSEVFVGPGYVCGLGFAIRLTEREVLTSADKGMDFVLYDLVSEEGKLLVYEGNAPEDADALIETGRDFPEVVALHLQQGDQSYRVEDISDRISVGRDFDRVCT